MIHLKSVEKYYNRGKANEIHVINNVSLELPVHGVVALFGKSGCGKTTLLNAIGGLSKIDKGEILVHGQNIGQNTDLIRNQYIGYIFQNYCLNTTESVYNNVADALRIAGIHDVSEIDNRVALALKSVGMEKYAQRLPETLSGGQQQRVAIARAIVKNPEVILADEPTGNLDEENTMLVMELLKEIGKQHLVLLVTHEANLIESYCDMIIELSDGSVSNIRENMEPTGSNIPDRNIIYLGELEKTEKVSAFGRVSYYGELPEEPMDVVIVRYQGRMYLKINKPQVHFLGENAEITLKEEKTDKKKKQKERNIHQRIWIEQLPQMEPQKIGCLFHWKNSLRFGWKNIIDGTRSNKLLRSCLFLFAMVLVLLTAFYGTSIKDIMDAKHANNANSFYAYVPDEIKTQELLQAVGNAETGIDGLEFSNQLVLGDQKFYIELTQLESSFSESWDEISKILFHGTLFSEDMVKDSKLVCGKKDGINGNEAVITTAVADSIINNSKFSFLNQYQSLLGFTAASGTENNSFIIVGIVNSEENAIYLSKDYFARKRYEKGYSALITTGEDYDINVEKGNTVLRVNTEETENLPSVGDTILLNGNPLSVSKVIDVRYSYEDWLQDNGIHKKAEEESGYADYDYLDYYYAEYSDYVLYCQNNRSGVAYDAYKELILNGCKEAWYVSVMELCERYDYYFAACFKRDNGYYPNEMELEEAVYTYNEPYEIVDNLLEETNIIDMPDCEYILNVEDYIDCSRRVGKSSGYGIHSTEDYGAYLVIHSVDPKATEKYLSRAFANITVPISTVNSYTTPDMLYRMKIEEYKEKISVSFAIWLILVVILCLCVYMIMRANMMKNVREIGIYRCIGVTRKNVLFRFFVENLVTIGGTAGVGYLAASVFLWFLSTGKYSYLINGVVFYPVWLGVILFILIIMFSIFFGLLPVLALLRKSPSDIMAKYDV